MTAYVVPNTATHATVVTIVYAEGEPEQMVIGFGSGEECDRVTREIPAVSVNGERQAVSASVSVYRLKPLCATCGQRHDEDEQDHCGACRALRALAKLEAP